MSAIKTLTVAAGINALVLGTAIAEEFNHQTHIEDYSMELDLSVKTSAPTSAYNFGAVDDEYSMELDLPTAEDYAAGRLYGKETDHLTDIEDYSMELDLIATDSTNAVLAENTVR